MSVPRCVVVVGAGLAGLTAAIRAREGGAGVLVLEGENTLATGANSRISGGVFHLAWGAMDAPSDELFDRMLEETDREVDVTVARSLARNAGPAVRWLEGSGVRLGPKGHREHDRFTALPWLPARGTERVPERGSELMIERLIDRARGDGVEFETGARVGTLDRIGERWSLVSADGRQWNADVVIVATGGFQASAELFERHVGPDPGSAFLRSTPTSRGDGHEMLRRLGVEFTSPSAAVYGHVLSASARANPDVWPQPTLDVLCRGGVVMTGAGEIVDSDVENGIMLVNSLVAAPGMDGLVVVFDEHSRAAASAEVGADGSPVKRQVDGHMSSVADLISRGAELIEADSLASLGELLRIDATTLVRAWHSRRGGARPNGPVCAMPVLPGVTSTLRGARVGGDFAVHSPLVPSGSLYAVGDLAGVHGGPRGGYLGGLAVALISGFVAGSAAQPARH